MASVLDSMLSSPKVKVKVKVCESVSVANYSVAIDRFYCE